MKEDQKKLFIISFLLGLSYVISLITRKSLLSTPIGFLIILFFLFIAIFTLLFFILIRKFYFLFLNISRKDILFTLLLSLCFGFYLILAIPIHPPLLPENIRQLTWFVTFTDSCNLSSIIFICSLILIQFPKRESASNPRKKLFWIWFAVPMIILWTIYLIAYYPGIMNSDSIQQWTQVQTGVFNDWNPPFHTFLIWILTRIWNSPAIVSIVQMLVLSIVITWGIGFLVELGVSSRPAWILALLFAISPVNATQAIILVKDIPYSAAVLWLAILIMKIVFSQGKWLGDKRNWLWLGICFALIALFRHNGFPISILTFILIILVYRTYWKKLILSGIAFLLIWLGIIGPIYSLVGVQKVGGKMDAVLLNYIAAQVNARTYLSPQESDYLNRVLPLSDWNYEPCLVDYIYAKSGNFDRALYSANSEKNINIFIQLIIRNPRVFIQHEIDANNWVWKIGERCNISTMHVFKDESGLIWISSNDYGLYNISVSPALSNWLYDYLLDYKFMPNGLKNLVNEIEWSPAIYLTISIFSVTILAIKRKSIKYLLIGAPPLFQALEYFFIPYSSYFRYLYSIYLIGLFSIGFFFISKISTDENLINNKRISK